MTLLIPLGLLGLLSIAALITIYIIKPNYQQKAVSSTYVWILSLKYKKKRLPVSRLRNILLIICQVLILVACALILARPSVVYNTAVSRDEIIAVIDSSASMYSKNDGKTRFERAIDFARRDADEVLLNGGAFSLVIADETGDVLADGITYENKRELEGAFEALLNTNGLSGCRYGVSDMDRAFSLCSDMLKENPTAKICVYTDKSYTGYVPDGVEIKNVSVPDEWNAAILDAYVDNYDGYYSIVVKVACYGVSNSMDLYVDVYGANRDPENESDTGVSLGFTQSVYCTDEKVQTVIFRSDTALGEDYEIGDENLTIHDISPSDRFYSYDSIYITFGNGDNDSFDIDNEFYIYGGEVKPLKVQYASSSSNKFFVAGLASVRNYFNGLWDIQIDEVKNHDVATSGYDFYVYEHEMPYELPTDGVVVLMDVQTALPEGVNISVGEDTDYNPGFNNLVKDAEHPILKNLAVENITVSCVNNLSANDPSYTAIASCDGKPVILVKNEEESKIVVLGFSLHYSNLAILKEFPLLLVNLFGYFFPATVSDTAAVINQTITLNAVGKELKCTNTGEVFSEFPASMTMLRPGTYSFEQTSYFGKDIVDNVYVRIPEEESNIKKNGDALSNPYVVRTQTEQIDDLLLWFAIALVALLFIEWLLQAKENF